MRAEFKRSFTLLESLVAIYVLVFGLVSAMSLASQSLGIVDRFKQELIASNLAQEGVELVRNRRDTNFLIRKKGGGCPDPCNPNDENMKGLTTTGLGFCDSTQPAVSGDPRGCRVDWKASDGENIAEEELGALDFRQCGNPSGNCWLLARHSNTGFYAHDPGPTPPSGWEATGFDRRIFIIHPIPLVSTTNRPPGLEDALVRVYVMWSDKFSGRRFMIVETALTPHLL